MAVFSFLIAAVVTVVAAFGMVRDPHGDRARLAEARRALRRAGRHYDEGSEAEAHALRVLLEGGTVDQI